MLAIKSNLMADNAARHLGRSYDALSKSVERLSSGLRINSSKDDAAGLAVRELIRADVAMFKQAARNAMDGINLLQTAEGAMASMDEILIRMKELAEQASNDTYSVKQRDIMDEEFTQLSEEITRIATSTKYNEKQLLNAAGTTVALHLGTGVINVTSADMTATGLSLDSNAAVTEVWKHSVYKSSADDLYLAATDIAAGVTDQFVFEFSVDGAPVDVDLNGYAATGISLNDLVTEINTAATYAAATAVYDADYGAYRLHLTAQTAGDTTVTWGDVGADNVLLLDGDADWVGSAPMTDGSAAGGSVSLASATASQAALLAVSTAIEDKDTYRAKLGYWMNRLEAAATVLEIQSENLSAAESRISDVDVATEMAAMTRNQVLAQSGIAMLGQANMMPQMALRLLQ
ncbi:MAG: hypothetical protein KAV00_10085 [Phycisphaerae bacterium]|nr:hypothetical protein [Phycisphaerae bacterium]